MKGFKLFMEDPKRQSVLLQEDDERRREIFHKLATRMFLLNMAENRLAK